MLSFSLRNHFQGTSYYLKEHYTSLAIISGDKPLHACDPLRAKRQPANNSALACKKSLAFNLYRQKHWQLSSTSACLANENSGTPACWPCSICLAIGNGGLPVSPLQAVVPFVETDLLCKLFKKGP